MKGKLLLKATLLACIISISLACKQRIANESSFGRDEASNSASAVNQQRDKKMSELVKVIISQLIAREEIRPPLGISPQPNRDIGFASIFVNLENHQDINQSVTIQKIEIRNIGDNRLQFFTFESRRIELKPLENSVIDIQLTNKTGYVGQGKVKAIVTYQVGNQVEKIESEVVDIDRH
jgi:hypothetical protein